MSTVHATAAVTTTRATTVRSRRKKSPARPLFCCAECKLVNDCDCLDTTRILDHLAPLLRQVIDHLQTDGSSLDGEVVERLELLCDRKDQREREWIAMPELGEAEDLKCDHVIVEDLIGHWGYQPAHLRTPEGIAALRKVPVEHVRGLLSRFLRESRPGPANPPTNVVEIFGKAFHGATEARPEPCAKPRRYAGQNFLFDFVDAEVA